MRGVPKTEAPKSWSFTEGKNFFGGWLRKHRRDAKTPFRVARASWTLSLWSAYKTLALPQLYRVLHCWLVEGSRHLWELRAHWHSRQACFGCEGAQDHSSSGRSPHIPGQVFKPSTFADAAWR